MGVVLSRTQRRENSRGMDVLCFRVAHWLGPQLAERVVQGRKWAKQVVVQRLESEDLSSI